MREVAQAVARLDVWLDSMRCVGGYGGPVVHWWRDCLLYAGPGLDWRYEGIIGGYLNLWRHTADERWLDKARRAGDDLVDGQLPDTCYRRSSFEANPASQGTPHEAACDLALFELAAALKEHVDANWPVYLSTAERNLEQFVLGRLWDAPGRRLCNLIGDASFVPNKAATTVEALLAWATLTGENRLIERVALPILDAIVACQVEAPGWASGAIAQSALDGQPDGRYFPFYIARCIPALVAGYRKCGDARYLSAAHRAARFVLSTQLADGSFPQVLYAGWRTNRYPQWVAGAADILRALELVRQEGEGLDLGPAQAWLLAGMQPQGSLRAAHGFAAQASQRLAAGPPDYRDLLGVCGWVDKAFRYLTACLPPGEPLRPAEMRELECDCVADGRPMRYRETLQVMQVFRDREVYYRWQKGSMWAELNLC